MAYEIRPGMAGSSPSRGKIYSWPVFIAVPARGRWASEIAVMTFIAKSLLAAAAIVTVLGFEVPAGHAASSGGWRNEPWCAFFEYDDVTVDCSYRTFEDCYPNVIGGIRGTCGPNPDGPGMSAPASAAAHKHKKQRPQQ
jgi:hypothetical protein